MIAADLLGDDDLLQIAGLLGLGGLLLGGFLRGGAAAGAQAQGQSQGQQQGKNLLHNCVSPSLFFLYHNRRSGGEQI